MAEAYDGLRHGYSMFVFVTLFLGILFFIAAGSVQYFKQFADFSSEREKFVKLYKLGITEKEIAGIISGELKLMFFTPLVFGSILGFSFIYFMTNWVGGQGVLGEFMANTCMVVAAYFVFQTIFYLTAKGRYTAKILDSLQSL
jgi:putative ABC transport system permease protein